MKKIILSALVAIVSYSSQVMASDIEFRVMGNDYNAQRCQNLERQKEYFDGPDRLADWAKKRYARSAKAPGAIAVAAIETPRTLQVDLEKTVVVVDEETSITTMRFMAPGFSVDENGTLEFPHPGAASLEVVLTLGALCPYITSGEPSEDEIKRAAKKAINDVLRVVD